LLRDFVSRSILVGRRLLPFRKNPLYVIRAAFFLDYVYVCERMFIMRDKKKRKKKKEEAREGHEKEIETARE